MNVSESMIAFISGSTYRSEEYLIKAANFIQSNPREFIKYILIDFVKYSRFNDKLGSLDTALRNMVNQYVDITKLAEHITFVMQHEQVKSDPAKLLAQKIIEFSLIQEEAIFRLYLNDNGLNLLGYKHAIN